MIAPLSFFSYCLIPLVLFISAEAGAEVKTRTIEYQQGNTVLEGLPNRSRV